MVQSEITYEQSLETMNEEGLRAECVRLKNKLDMIQVQQLTQTKPVELYGKMCENDDLLKVRDLLLKLPELPSPIFKSRDDVDNSYIITRATHDPTCGNYRLYNSDDVEVVWFSPPRPDASNPDMIRKLLSCYITDECHIISLSDVQYYPDRDYPNCGHVIRGVIERTIKNYIIYLCPLFENLLYRIPYGREHEMPFDRVM